MALAGNSRHATRRMGGSSLVRMLVWLHQISLLLARPLTAPRKAVQPVVRLTCTVHLHLHLHLHVRAQVVSTTLAGAAVGSLTGGGLADALGRRKAFIVAALPMLAGPALCAYAQVGVAPQPLGCAGKQLGLG